MKKIERLKTKIFGLDLPVDKTLSLKSLSPNTDANIKIYEDSINFAIMSSDITNIAITGNYGAGKSSILNTYEKKHPELMMMHIELPHYRTEDTVETKGLNSELSPQNVAEQTKINDNSAEDTDLYSVEEKIINQLLAQVNPGKIPLSVFHSKRNKCFLYNLLEFVTPILFLISFVYTVLAVNKNSVLYSFNMVPTITNVQRAILLMLVTGVLISLQIYFWLKKGWGIRNIRVKSGVVNLDASQDKIGSYFDKYMSDVLYLFENAGTDYFVFEDLDRFDIPLIYERLHELNVLLNKRSGKSNRHQYRFFYMLKDDSFVSKDRSKIFDFIIPVIPILNSTNSYEMVKKTLSNSAKDVPDIFLRKLSIYIDDMRLLLNISNEFQIYQSRLKQNGESFESSKLLGIITYKNVFPQDFSKLQFGISYINCIIDDRKKLINQLTAQYKKRLAQINTQLSDASQMQLDEVIDLESLYLDFSSVNAVNRRSRSSFKNDVEMMREYHDSGEKNTTYSGWNYKTIEQQLKELSQDSTFSEKKGAVMAKNKTVSENLQNEIKDLHGKITEAKALSLGELLQSKSQSYFENVVSDDSDFASVLNNRYFPLILFLLRESVIDEHYSDYISYFYEGQLTQNDKNFLREKFDNQFVPYDYKLDHPEVVIDYLSSGDFKRYGIENVLLTTFLLKHSSKFASELSEIVKTTLSLNDIKFIQQMLIGLRSEQNQLLINLFFENLTSNSTKWIVLCSRYYAQEDASAFPTFIVDLLKFMPIDKLQGDNWISVMEWLSINSKVFFDIEPDALQDDEILQPLMQLGCKFGTISSISKENIKLLCQHELVDINKPNINTLTTLFTLKHNDENNVISNLLSENGEWMSIFIKNNLIQIVASQLSFSLFYIEKEDVIVDVINSPNSDNEFNSKLLSKWTGTITNIQTINSLDFKNLIVEKGKLEPTGWNIQKYLSSRSYQYNVPLTEIINQSKEEIVFSTDIDKEEQKKIFSVLIQVNDIDEKKLITMLCSLDQFYLEGYPETLNNTRNLQLLIENGFITLNVTNMAQTADQSFANLSLYIKQGIDDFISVLDHLNLSESQRMALVYDPYLSDEERARVIEWNNLPLDFMKIQLGEKSALAALKVGIKEENVFILMDSLNSYDKTTREYIFAACSKFSNKILDYLQINWDKNTTEEFLACNDVPLSLRQHFFSISLKDHFSIKEIPNWLRTLNYSTAFERVLSRGRQTVPATVENTELFQAFVSKQLVTTHSSITNQTIQMFGKDNFKKIL